LSQQRSDLSSGAVLSHGQHSSHTLAKSHSLSSHNKVRTPKENELDIEFPSIPNTTPKLPTSDVENLHFPEIRGYDGDPKPKNPSVTLDDDELLARFQRLKKK
jgi:hypothetical protein